MSISILLVEKIFSMLLACFVGFVVVRGKLLKTEESKVFSKIVAYVCSPCAIVSAYIIEFNMEILQGLLLTFVIALVWHVVVIALAKVIGRTFKLNGIEQASITYSNAGYLVIPVVYAVLGPEWVIYTSGFSMIQSPLLWTHCKSLLCGEKKFDAKKVLLNPNFIAIYLGVILFVTGMKFPTAIQTTISDFGSMIGTVSMFVIGMLIAEQDLKKMFVKKKIYLICFLRLVLIPIVTVLAFWGIQKVIYHPELHNILLVVLWAACAPVGAMVTQLSQIYNLDSEYAGRINLISILFCIITMPFITYFYEWITLI